MEKEKRPNEEIDGDESSRKRSKLDKSEEKDGKGDTGSSDKAVPPSSGTAGTSSTATTSIADAVVAQLKTSSSEEKEPDEKPSGDAQQVGAGEEKDAAAARTALILEEDLQFESGFLSFPEKLMSLLEGGEVKESMYWLPEGDSFCIVPATFEAILDKHFQGTKFESFTRKLNRWGFKRVAGQKVPVNTIAYFHHDFRRGQKDQLKDMSGSKTRMQATRDLRTQQQVLQSIELGEAANMADRQCALYAAQLGVGPISGTGGGDLGFDSYLGESGEMKDSRLHSLLEQGDLGALAGQRDALGNAELQMRLLRGARAGGGDNFIGDFNDSSSSNQSQLSDSVLASLAAQQGGSVADQLRARELTTRLMLSQSGGGGGNMFPSSTSDIRARLLAQTYGDSSSAAALLGRQQQLNASADFSQSRLLSQASQQGLLPGVGADRGGAGVAGLAGPDSSFDLSQSRLLASTLGNRDFRNPSGLGAPSTNRLDQWQQQQGGLGQSQTNEAEQLLQLYMLQQQQQQQRDQQQRDQREQR